MAELVGPVIQVGKCIGGPIKRQLNYLCCFTTNTKNLEAEATKLNAKKADVDDQAAVAQRNNGVILREVGIWQANVNEIQEKWSGVETEIQDVKSGCLAIKSRFLLSRKAKKMAAAIKVLLNDGEFERIANPALPAAMTSIPLGQINEFESRKRIEEGIMTALREKKVGMMGIWGMGGVGKTTMAKKIMSRAKGEGLFAEIVMVVVSQFGMFEIQQQMAELVGLELKDITVPARAHRLRCTLMNSKSILIILDDLWKRLDLEELGIPHERDAKECVILLTSRNTDVCNAMNVQRPFHELKILEAEEAWSLFKEKVGACADDQTLFSTAQEIVRECNGLPIALVTVGSALKDKKNEAIWKNAQRELKSGYPEGISDFLAKVYNPLKLSYDLLEDEQAKSIFLLCCLFPEDHNIRLSDLSLYAWGLGTFERITSLQDTRNKVQATIETLKSRSLLLDGWDETFTKMHDVVRDVGIFIAGQKKLIDHNLDCNWISSFHPQPKEKTTLPKIMLPGGSGFPNLRFLLISKSIGLDVGAWEELPLCDNFFERATELSVLSIKGYIMKSLPNTIQLLRNLRTLILIACSSLEDISIVGELVSLEILYCRDCDDIKELPENIGRQLKLLHMEHCRSLTIGARVISRLIELEELTLIHSFSKWESRASDGKNARLCELNCLSSLTTLRIEIEDASLAAEQIHLPDFVEFQITIGNWGYNRDATSYGKQMRLKLDREVFIQGWIHQLLRNTESLDLQVEGSSKLVPLERLPKLQRLWDVVPLFCNLSSISIIECHSICSLFPWNDHLLRLKSIRIGSCWMLEQIVMWDEEVDVGSSSRNHRHITFPKLNELELRDLPRLTSFCKGIQSFEFPLLIRMEINKCPNLKSLDSSTGDDSSHLFCKSDQAAFGKLDRLVINGWCDQIPVGFFTRLGHLSLSHCGKIEILFSLSIASNLVHLRELRIQSCGEMVKVMEDEVDEVEIRCPFINLKELSLKNLPKLKAFCDWRCAPELPSLRRLYISKCPLLERLSFLSITSPISSYSFENLESIEIKSCSMLEQVVLWNEEENGQDMNGRRITFPKLKKLELDVLPRLISFCKGIQSIEFPLLTRMEITECPNLESLKAAFGGLENLVIDGYENITIKSLFSPSTAENLVNLRDLTNERVSLWCDQISMDFFTRLVTLKLCHCGNINSLFLPSIARNLVNLKELSIISCREMVKVIEDEETGMSPFIKLEVLTLINLPKLKAFWRCALHLPSLRKVYISNCPRMERFSIRSIISPISSDSFENLECIEIISCSMLEQAVLWNEEENGKKDINGRSGRITFPKLKQLFLDDLPRLTSFCKGIQSIDFPLLTKIIIMKCPNLKSLVSSKENNKRCPGSINYDADDSLLHLFCKSQAAFGRLNELDIQGYEKICSKISVSLWCDQIPVDLFTGLSVLKVTDCGIKSLFSPSIAGNLVNLRELTIGECCEMVKVIEEEEEVEMSPFMKLARVTLFKLPKLKAFCDWRCALHLPSLSYVSISECPEMERFSFGILTTPKLEEIHLSRAAFGGLEHLVLDGYIKSLFSPSTTENLVNLRDLTNERVSLWCDQISMDFFTRLVTLKLCHCGNIKSLFSPSIARNLVNLKKLTIESCREMVKVIECSRISPISFENLESLSIRECSMLEQVVLWNEEENGEEDIDGQSSCITFPKFKKLFLYHLPRLTSFCKGIQSIELPLLTEMAIVKCPNLKSLVSSKENDKRCPGVDADDSLLQEPSTYDGLSVLRVNDCGIKSLFSSSIARNLVNLKKLTIESCCEMVKVIEEEEEEEVEMSPFIKQTELTMESCGEMVKAIEDEEVEMSPFIKLRRLKLEKLPKLKAFCDWRCSLYMPSLDRVVISECPELERFSFGSLTTPKLEVISIDSENFSDYTKDLNDALFVGHSLDLDILFGTDH